uniref:Chromatin assembly factor 1, subunit A (p150) n=1 Tax=Takifugu rubripes TaxID=31033 RepID=H2VC85_TAKRU
MDCKSSNNSSKKLVQARLPFKRLNPEPKENQLPKRLCEHACPQPEVSDGENESSSLPLHGGPPLVNGRGPLDGFLSRRRPEPSNENVIVDLTTDDTLSPAKPLVSPPPAFPRLRPKGNRGKSETTTSVKSSNVDHTSNSQTSEEMTTANEDVESLQEQEERLRLQQEKQRQKEEAKAVKEKKKEEARKIKEERQREKREKKEKEERERREKKEKDEKEKAERLKRLKAEKAEITRFLQKSKIQQAPKTLAAACGKFAPFEIKENVYLAPLCRVQREDGFLSELDRSLLNQADNWHGLKDWIGRQPRQSGPTTPSDCVVVDGPRPDGVPDRKRYGPMKLLQFRENYRPAYWGTWSKKSSHVSPRCPFRQDKNLLDYDVDSDEEWEEEEPGESLSHSEGEDEEEGGDDDDDDDGFFVPHGYLSDDEGAQEEEESGDPEKLKLQQKLKAREWDELMSTKKKMKILEPVVKGCIWEGEGPGLQLFQLYALCWVEPLPKADSSPSQEELTQRGQREEQLLCQLLPLLHGNVNSSKMMITEFQEFCRQQAAPASSPDLSSPQNSTENVPTRIQVKRLIKENAVYEKRPSYKRCCWYVHAEMLSRFGQEALPVPCQWTYLTAGAREEPTDEPQAATSSQGNSPTTPQTSSTTSASKKRKSTGSMSITKFMKRGTIEPDGFQADTEDDDEEDCIIMSTQPGDPFFLQLRIFA